jgi:phospholipid-translocating ATPase
MVVCSLFLLAGSGRFNNPLVLVFKYILLLSTIIPISLRLNLDFSKLFFSRGISSDPEMGAVARNSTIPEELGRIQVIFSDKTGTITANEMMFKRLSSENLRVRDDDKRIFDQIRAEIENYDRKKEDISLGHLYEKNDKSIGETLLVHFLVLNLCHNVTPVDESGLRVL